MKVIIEGLDPSSVLEPGTYPVGTGTDVQIEASLRNVHASGAFVPTVTGFLRWTAGGDASVTVVDDDDDREAA